MGKHRATNTYVERRRLVTVVARWKGRGPRNVALRRANGQMVVRPFRGLRRIAGPIDVPHPIEACYGSRLHCWSHDIDEPDLPWYRACFECKHVYRTAAELLAEHNKVLAQYDVEPETDAADIYTCPLCTHDF